MHTIEVIPAQRLRNVATGTVISPFSVLPFGRREDWERVTYGYTWGVTSASGSYTQGLGRAAAKTISEAREVARHYAEVTGATVVEG